MTLILLAWTSLPRWLATAIPALLLLASFKRGHEHAAETVDQHEARECLHGAAGLAADRSGHEQGREVDQPREGHVGEHAAGQDSPEGQEEVPYRNTDDS